MIWYNYSIEEVEKSMYLTVKQQLKHLSKEEYLSLRELSHTAKNLYNQAVYNLSLIHI